MCPHCDKPTLATVTGDAPGGGKHEPPYLLELVRCGTCYDPFLVIEEDYGEGWDGEPVILWPKQQRPLSVQVPEALRREHDEARQCFSSKAYMATAVMVRRTLEGVCLDQGMSNTGGRWVPGPVPPMSLVTPPPSGGVRFNCSGSMRAHGASDNSAVL